LHAQNSYPDSLQSFLNTCNRLSIHSLVKEDTSKYDGEVDAQHLEGMAMFSQ